MTEPISLTLKDAAALVGATPRHLLDEFRSSRILLKNKNRSGTKPAYVVEYAELKRWVADLPDAVPNQRAS
ncbi:hypothetical protein GCM10007298_38140 [Williamsia phyllosphaerae]|uniref:Helix-turn-helix domain-containing protein n=1 Tax=Williamsia phyllosphaerae TaxID=885042 RepID=A0ABQ1V6E7_9NOCA|nr:hypothetical protein GCM10007298_38140 [Williamsia phyllosphaerae]